VNHFAADESEETGIETERRSVAATHDFQHGDPNNLGQMPVAVAWELPPAISSRGDTALSRKVPLVTTVEARMHYHSRSSTTSTVAEMSRKCEGSLRHKGLAQENIQEIELVANFFHRRFLPRCFHPCPRTLIPRRSRAPD
jgi:hypothetical protein